MTAAEAPNNRSLESIVERYIQSALREYPLDSESLDRRARCIKSDMILFLQSHLDEIPKPIEESRVLDLLNSEFGAAPLLREDMLREDAHNVHRDPGGRLILAATVIIIAALAAMIEIGKFAVVWSWPSAAATASSMTGKLLIAAAPFTGLAGYMACHMVKANRYRIVPFALISTLAFALAGSMTLNCTVLETSPLARFHVLLSVTIPSTNTDLSPVLYRYTIDFDRTGLPAQQSRAKFISLDSETASTGTVLLYWLTLFGVTFGNFYVMRLVGEYATLEETISAT